MVRVRVLCVGVCVLVRLLAGVSEMYDLAADPLETNNLYTNSSASELVLEMRLALLDWCVVGVVAAPALHRVDCVCVVHPSERACLAVRACLRACVQ